MLHICTNEKCGKIFVYNPLHIGLNNKVFCSADCKNSYVSEAPIINVPTFINTFQCPHCNKICRTNNAYQKICASVDCKDKQRKLRKQKNENKIKSLKDIGIFAQRYDTVTHSGEVTRSEVAKQYEVGRHKEMKLMKLQKEEILRECVECSKAYYVKKNPNGKIRQYCENKSCEKEYKRKYARMAYEKFKERLGPEALKEYQTRQNLKYIRNLKLKTMKQLSLPTSADPVETVPEQKDYFASILPPRKAAKQYDEVTRSVADDIQRNIVDLLKDYKDAIEGNIFKYVKLIDYLESNDLNDITQLGELLNIIKMIKRSNTQ